MSDETDPIREIATKRDELFRRAANAPAVQVVGVVGPLGASKSRVSREKDWTLSFELQPWRVLGSGLESAAMSVYGRGSVEELNAIQGSIQPYSVLSLLVRPLLQPDGERLSVFERFVGNQQVDAELLAAADQLRAPVIHHDELFGALVLDRRLGTYACETQWNGRKIRLAVSATADGSPASGLSTARELWKNQHPWEERVKDFAAFRLLDLRNESWAEHGEGALESDQFKDRMTLSSISVRPDGEFEFWYDDGGLFCGHAILVTGNLTLGPREADTPG